MHDYIYMNSSEQANAQRRKSRSVAPGAGRGEQGRERFLGEGVSLSGGENVQQLDSGEPGEHTEKTTQLYVKMLNFMGRELHCNNLKNLGGAI